MKLTDIQHFVLSLDRGGLTPTEISRETGLTVKRVSNVKKRLATLGYAVSHHRRKRGASFASPGEGIKWTEDLNDW